MLCLVIEMSGDSVDSMSSVDGTRGSG